MTWWAVTEPCLNSTNQDDWTTDTICKACGCKVNGFICDCGLRAAPDKLECIRNGGPARAVSVRR